ncbi:hypothetical protein Tco_0329310 [Tanacetum coccineum]
MSTSTHPIIVPSDSDIEDAFSFTHTPDYTSASPNYFPASPGNTSPDPSDDLSKYLLASLAISPFHNDPYMKVMQAYNATNNESPIPLLRAPIPLPTILPSSPVLPLSSIVHKQISNNPYTSFGFVMSLNDYRGLDVPTAKLFLIPTGKLMVPAGSSWFLLVVPAGRLCGSCWSAYGFCC